jgi:hypothetical protein
VVHSEEGTLLRVQKKKNRITEDSESSARWALSRCIGAQEKKTELLNVLWKRRNSARRASSQCADRHRREKRTL